MSKAEIVLLQLLRVSLGNERSDVLLPNDVFWQEVFELSVKQGVVNIAYDGLQSLLDANPEETFGFDSSELENLKYKWIGYGMSAELSYQRYVNTISALAELYQSLGLQMLLFKGYSLALNYPVPSHRPVGDIDIVVINSEGELCQRQADLLLKKLGIDVLKSRTDHHSCFPFRGVTVENHYEFSNIYRAGRKGKEFEKILQAVCFDADYGKSSINGIFFTTATFNALFLMWHLARHFCGSYISIRQLCDFWLFLEQDYEKVNWKYVKKVYHDYGLYKFARVIDGTLDRYFHAKKHIFNDGIHFSELEFRLMDDIYHPKEYDSMISRLLRYPRFSWKFKLVHDKSWISLFFNSLYLYLFHKEDRALESL